MHGRTPESGSPKRTRVFGCGYRLAAGKDAADDGEDKSQDGCARGALQMGELRLVVQAHARCKPIENVAERRRLSIKLRTFRIVSDLGDGSGGWRHWRWSVKETYNSHRIPSIMLNTT